MYHPFLSSHISSPLHTKCTCSSKIATNQGCLSGICCPRFLPTGDVFHPTVPSFLGSATSRPSYKQQHTQARSQKASSVGIFPPFFLYLFVFLSVFTRGHLTALNCIFTSSMFWAKWEPQNLSVGVFFKCLPDLILAGIFSAGIFCPFSGSTLENKSRYKATGKSTKNAGRLRKSNPPEQTGMLDLLSQFEKRKI